MAYSYDFKDSKVYGADNINAIRASILTKGVVEETVTSCKVVAKNSGVTIMQGQAVFGDGCRIEVDSEGVDLAITPSAENYIYFYNNTLAGVCEVKADTVAPHGDYVLLAKVDENGIISDEREFAQLKTADTERYAASFSGSVTMHDDMEIGEIIGEIELPKSNCSLIEMEYRFASETPINVRLFPKEDGFVHWRFANGHFNSGEIFSVNNKGKIRGTKFEVSGNILTLRHMSISSSSSTEINQITIIGTCIR